MNLQEIYERHLIYSLEDVKRDTSLLQQVQTRLQAVGLYAGKVDGLFGPKTLKGLEEFCNSHYLDNLKSGLFGSTWAKALIEAKPDAKLQPVTQAEHISLIFHELENQGIDLVAQRAYVLATVQHETANTYKPIDEIGGRHTRYAPFWGRGYVQLTWRSNYQKYARLLNLDLENHPELAKEPFAAAFILVHGFRTGAFTGKKITDFIYPGHCDFIGARRCINGVDRAATIASLAQQWQVSLTKV